METGGIDFFLKSQHKISYSVWLFIILYTFNTTAAPIKQRTAFGVVHEFSTQKNPQELFIANVNGNEQMDFGVRSKTEIALFRRNSLGYFYKKEFPLHSSSTGVTVSDFNNDGYDDVAVLEEQPTTIEMFWGTIRDHLYSSLLLHSKKNYDKLMSLDINNDKFIDMIMFGRSSLGIEVIQQNAEGEFKSTGMLFKEMAIDNIVPADFNNDGEIDLLVHDCITNKIVLNIQRGKLKFSTIHEWQLTDTPFHIEVNDINGDGILDIVTGFSEGKFLTIQYGDSLGDYSAISPVSFSSSFDAFSTIKTDNNNTFDILTLHKNIFSIYLNSQTDENDFTQKIDYVAGKNPIALLPVSLEGRYPDVIVLNKEQEKILEFTNSRNVTSLEQEQRFSTGITPIGIISVDVNKDGLNDIIVANEGTSSLSFFLYDRSAGFNGQFSVSIADSPAFIWSSASDSIVSLVTTSQKQPTISSIEIVPNDFSLSSSNAVTENISDVKWYNKNKKTKLASIIVESPVHEVNSKTTYQLSFLEEISKGNFVEQIIPSVTNQHVLGSIVANISSERNTDILYASIDNQFHMLSFYIAKQTFQDSLSFLPPAKIFSLSDSSSDRVLLWYEDINDDKLGDIVGNIDGNTNTLFFCLHNKNSMFFPPTQRLNNILISRYEFIQFFDYNKDGSIDVVLYNDFTKSVEVCYNRGNGTFQNPIRIFSVENIGGFVVGNFNNDSIPDIVYTEPERGVMTVHYGK